MEVPSDTDLAGSGAFGYSLFRLAQGWRRAVDGRMRRFGLTDATWRPLFYLGRNGEGIRQTDLAAALAIEGPSLVRLLDALEIAGLLARHGDPTDRRSKTLHLTEAGRSTYRQVAAEYERFTGQLLGAIPPAELVACLAVFARIEVALAAQATEA